jgi:hypothetical protein
MFNDAPIKPGLQGEMRKLEGLHYKLNRQFLDAIQADVPARDEGLFHPKLRLLSAVKSIQAITKQLVQAILPPPSVTYILSSLFLRDCYNDLTRNTQVESLVYATGIRVGQYAIISRILPVKLDSRTPAYAAADPASSHHLLLSLHELGHKLLGVFHTHMGNGPRAIFPSSIDLKTQLGYEKAKYACIGGIFSLDGYVNFFGQTKSPVLIYGKGVTKYGERLYKIERSPLSYGGDV